MFQKLLNLIYPKTCCFCGAINERGICKSCAEKVVYITEPRCKKCGKPVRYEEQEYCYDCQKQTHAYDQGRSLWLHKMPVSMSIYQFKYENRRVYGAFYAKELARAFAGIIRTWQIDVIVPVPLHAKKRRLRGYNQAEIIARQLGRLLNIRVDTHLVRRVRYTNPQKELNDKERRKNLKHAFSVMGDCSKYQNVLIVDDIYTTGSTIDTISLELKRKGVQKVCFLTISIGQGF